MLLGNPPPQGNLTHTPSLRFQIQALVLPGLIVVGFAWWFGPMISADPAPAFSPAQVDLGDQFWGTVVPVSLTLTNRGPEPVKILSAKTSCGCTVLDDEFRNRVIEPGTKIPLELKLDTERIPGRKKRTVTLNLNSGVKATAELTVKVLSGYEITPKEIDFGDVDLNEAGELVKIVTFTSAYGRKLTDAPRLNCDWMACSAVARGNGWEIAIRLLRERLPPGCSTATVAVSTDDPSYPEQVVFVSARGIQALNPEPSHVFLSGTSPQRVAVFDQLRQPVNVASCAPGDERIRTEINSDGSIEVSNPLAESLPQVIPIEIRDQRGRTGRLLVSTF